MIIKKKVTSNKTRETQEKESKGWRERQKTKHSLDFFDLKNKKKGKLFEM